MIDRKLNEMTKVERVDCVKPKGAFYLFPNITRTGLKSEGAAKVLLEKGKVASAPGAGVWELW